MKPSNETAQTHICPKCGRQYTQRPALSRTDNETLICPDCGVREALDSIGVTAEEQEEILRILHNAVQENP